MVLVLGAKVVQVEHNGKKNVIFLAIVERQPTFAAGNCSPFSQLNSIFVTIHLIPY